MTDTLDLDELAELTLDVCNRLLSSDNSYDTQQAKKLLLAAPALIAAAKERDALKARLAEAEAARNSMAGMLAKRDIAAAALRSRVEKLEAVLRPFAAEATAQDERNRHAADGLSTVTAFTIGQCRRARAALTDKEPT
jgi:hypothetical protein